MFVVDFDTSIPNWFLDALSNSISDVSGTPLGAGFENASGHLFEFIGERFDTFSRGGGYWEWLSPYTIKKKEGSYGGSGAGGASLILIETGRLRESMNRGGEGHIQIAMPDGYEEGTEDPNAERHQNGSGLTTDWKRPLPQRTIIPEDVAEIPDSTIQLMNEDLSVGFQGLINDCIGNL
jgi:hypothetical protein